MSPDVSLPQFNVLGHRLVFDFLFVNLNIIQNCHNHAILTDFLIIGKELWRLVSAREITQGCQTHIIWSVTSFWARVSVGSSVRSVIIHYGGGELRFNVSVEALVFFFCQKLAMFTSVWVIQTNIRRFSKYICSATQTTGRRAVRQGSWLLCNSGTIIPFRIRFGHKVCQKKGVI